MRRAFVVFLCVAAVYFFLIVPVLNEDKPQSEINGGGEPDFFVGRVVEVYSEDLLLVEVDSAYGLGRSLVIVDCSCLDSGAKRICALGEGSRVFVSYWPPFNDQVKAFALAEGW